MNILELSDEFDKLLSTSQEFKILYSISFAFSSTENIEKRKIYFLSLGEDRPAWTSHITEHDGKKTLSEVFDEIIPRLESPELIWKSLSRWLDLILYSTCAFVPHMVEENAINIAIGHPLGVFLFKYAETIDAACRVGMKISSKFFQEVPIVLIRLMELTLRFRTFVLPKMIELHKESIEECKQHLPEYMKLF